MTTPPGPPATLVVLHGHDDDPASVETLGRAMAATAWAVVAPAGPVATGDGRRAWWRSDDDGAPMASDVEDAVAVVDEAVRRAAAAAPVVLGGFSQGGALALAWSLRGTGPASPAQPLTGTFAIGAWLPDLAGLETDLAAVAARRLPVLIGHGADDEAVPLMLGRSAARLLHRAGLPVTYVQLDVGHELAPFASAVGPWSRAALRGEEPSDPP